jgi:hypothetical protein
MLSLSRGRLSARSGGENEEQVCYLKDIYYFWITHLINRFIPATHLRQTEGRKAKFFSPLLLSTNEKTSFVQIHE